MLPSNGSECWLTEKGFGFERGTVAEVEGGLGEKCLYCLKEICVIGWHVGAAGSYLSLTENDRKCLERHSLFPLCLYRQHFR